MTILKIGFVETAGHMTAGRRGQLQRLREISSQHVVPAVVKGVCSTVFVDKSSTTYNRYDSSRWPGRGK